VEQKSQWSIKSLNIPTFFHTNKNSLYLLRNRGKEIVLQPPPVQAMATLHAVDFPLSGSPTTAGKGQDPANVCQREVKQST